MPKIKFNPSVKLILSDVDETIADVYTRAVPQMIAELNALIDEGRSIFLVSGGGLQSIRERIVDLLEPEFRHRVIVGHCMGAEVWGFEKGGEIKSKPYYGLYEGHFTETQKEKWRETVNLLIEKFHLKTYPAQAKKSFRELTQEDPLAVMLADRGAQITLEFVNSVNLTVIEKERLEKELKIKIPLNNEAYDLRYPVLAEGIRLYKEANLPIQVKFGGTMALDNIIAGVSKTRAIKYIMENEQILNELGLTKNDVNSPVNLEIWGDKFDKGPDIDMCAAVSPAVRAISFRDENKVNLSQNYNIQLWDGKKRLHEGLLEYLQLRQS